jgi:hypothetical protein
MVVTTNKYQILKALVVLLWLETEIAGERNDRQDRKLTRPEAWKLLENV